MVTPATPDTADSIGATTDDSKGGLFTSGSSTALVTIQGVISELVTDAQTIETNVEAIETRINDFGLAGLTDVTVTSISDNELLQYDSGTSKWINQTLAEAGAITASSSDTLTNKTLTSPVFNTGVSGSAVLDSDTMSGASATTLATSESIKAYVDAQVDTADSLAELSDVTITGTPADNEFLAYDTSASKWINQTAAEAGVITAASSDTLTNKAIDSANNTITNIVNADIKSDAAIAITKLASSSVNYGGVSLALGASDATPAFNLSDATNYPTSSLSGTITNAQLAGSIANAKLSNSSITVSDGSSSTATALGGTITFAGTTNEVEVGESSGTITVGLPDNVTIGGNLTVSGTTTTVNTATLSVEDPLIKLANNNSGSDAVDIGFYGLYDTSGSQDLYAGLFRDANDSGKFKLFKDLQAEPDTTVNTSGTGYAAGTLVASLEGNVTGNVSGTAATVTGAAQSSITSLGTLTTLSVDNITINGNDISSTAGTDLTITPLSGQQIVLDGTIVVDAGVVTGATSITSDVFVGPLTGNVTGNTSGSSGSTTGNAATATALASAVNIGGVSFNGTGNIDLPGVNTAGNQNTSGTAALATAVTATANNTADETVYPTFVDGATGTQGLETDTGLNYNPSTGVLTSTTFTGNLTGDASGNAATATTATNVTVSDESSDTTSFPLFATAATGNLPPKSGSNLTFNSSSGLLTATLLAGDLTGDVTGNVSGSSGSTTGNAATATALASARTIGGTSFDGTGNIAVALASVGTAVTVADESSDTTCFPLFTTAATGDLPPKSGSNLTFNSSSGTLAATAFSGDGSALTSVTSSVSGAQTAITSILNAALVVGRDADNQIKFSTDDQIIFEVSGGDNVIFKASGEIEATSLDIGSGGADINGTLEADVITVAGVALSTVIANEATALAIALG